MGAGRRERDDRRRSGAGASRSRRTATCWRSTRSRRPTPASSRRSSTWGRGRRTTSTKPVRRRENRAGRRIGRRHVHRSGRQSVARSACSPTTCRRTRSPRSTARRFSSARSPTTRPPRWGIALSRDAVDRLRAAAKAGAMVRVRTAVKDAIRPTSSRSSPRCTGARRRRSDTSSARTCRSRAPTTTPPASAI